ncbi:MAG: phage virion morphogenesis protein [Pseudomonadota bacterium]
MSIREDLAAGDLDRALATLRQRLADLAPAMERAGGIVRESVAENFARQGRPTPWKASRRAGGKDGNGGKTLSLSGRLARSIRQAVRGNSVTVESTAPHAATHQFGARQGEFGHVKATIRAHLRKGRPVKAHTRTILAPWGDIPPRPFLLLQDEDRVAINNAIHDFLTKGLS